MNLVPVLRAITFAADKHRDQRRKDENASPYINHPLAVASVLSVEAGIADGRVLIDAPVSAGSVRHDVFYGDESAQEHTTTVTSRDLQTAVVEELDRLDSHIVEIRDVLQREEPVGRRLDFLMQELNREANTLGSKSNDTETTKAAVDIKVLLEQMREQVQNVE